MGIFYEEDVIIVGNVITRKCACCKGAIEIDAHDINNVVYFQDKYYHYNCFVLLASEKSAMKRGKPQMWKDALDSIWELEADTKKMLERYFAKDELNTWLLDNYDVVTVPNYFWQLVADLEKGMYKRKKCKPVSTRILFECWRWGQKKLNEINQYNKSHGKGPKDDGARLMYDLAVLVGKVPNYLAYKEKQKAAEIERRRSVKENIKVDYSKISNNNKIESNNLQDISSLVDDIF